MCTNFKLPMAQDGTIVIGRSLEYPALTRFALCALPKGMDRRAIGPDSRSPTKAWKTAHGVVGVTIEGTDAAILDGMNTAGLSAHLLYMVGGYFHPAEFQGDGTDVSQIELVSYLLSTCASIEEVRATMAEINVWGWSAGLPFTPPIHVLVHDHSNSVAIEFRPEGMFIVDNPTGVATNSPYLDWHLANLNNYIGISAENPDRQVIHGASGDLPLRALGVGWGLHGIPGDYSGPSRFIRALALTTLATPPKDAAGAEMLALHILNTFDVPAGVVKEPGPHHSVVDEITYVDTICNLTDLRFCYRALDDPMIYVIDVAATDFTGSHARFLPLSAQGTFTPITI